MLERLQGASGAFGLVVYGNRGTSDTGYTGLPTVVYPIDEVVRATRRFLVSRLSGSRDAPRVEVIANAFIEPAARTTAP